MSSETKYQRLGDDYHWQWAKNPDNPYVRWVKRVLAELPSDGAGLSVLDVGSGDGYPASLLVAQGFTVYGVEPLEGPRKVAEQRAPDAFFEPLYPVRPFDYVLALDSIEHMDDTPGLVQAVRVCDKYAIISTPPPSAGEENATKSYDMAGIVAVFGDGFTVELITEDSHHQLFKVAPIRSAPAKPTPPKAKKPRPERDTEKGQADPYREVGAWARGSDEDTDSE